MLLLVLVLVLVGHMSLMGDEGDGGGGGGGEGTTWRGGLGVVTAATPETGGKLEACSLKLTRIL